MPILAPDFQINLTGHDVAGRYARKLLGDLGASVQITDSQQLHPARRWADSGLMALPGSPPALCPVPLPDCADGTLDAFRSLVGTQLLPTVRGSQLLAERAAISGDKTSPSSSPGDHCRLLPTRDGVIGLNLARDDDWLLLPAWLSEEQAHTWDSIQPFLLSRSTEMLVERGRLLGLAVVDAQGIPSGPCSWVRCSERPVSPPAKTGKPLVLDLSSLWAGPLCSHLWQAAGAEVIKIESSVRPDGARSGSAEFFDLLNRGKRAVTLDLHKKSGQRELYKLIQQADIILEGSRPRALRQMGIFAEDMIREKPGLSWVSITGYGRQEPQANWIAYGDDAAVAAGLSAIMHEATGQWLICGDAIADPLTGLHAALAGWASWLAGGGHLIALSLEQTVRHCITMTAPKDNDYRARHRQWSQYLVKKGIVPAAPQRRHGG